MAEPWLETIDVGVVGAGTMGAGIASLLAARDIPVTLVDSAPLALERAAKRLRRAGVNCAVSSRAAVEDRAERVQLTSKLSDLKDCSLVIEAVSEDVAIKTTLLRELDESCHPSAVFATNTSSLSVAQLAAGTRRPGRIAGLHFFNPPTAMELVEVVGSVLSDDGVVRWLVGFVEESVGYTAVTTRDRPGFIANALLVPYLLNAIHMVEVGECSVGDVDRTMTLGCGHPMGPMELADFIGLDVVLTIGRHLRDYDPKACPEPPTLLARLVAAGHLGKKTGRGLRSYDADVDFPRDAVIQAPKVVHTADGHGAVQ